MTMGEVTYWHIRRGELGCESCLRYNHQQVGPPCDKYLGDCGCDGDGYYMCEFREEEGSDS